MPEGTLTFRRATQCWTYGFYRQIEVWLEGADAGYRLKPFVVWRSEIPQDFQVCHCAYTASVQQKQ